MNNFTKLRKFKQKAKRFLGCRLDAAFGQTVLKKQRLKVSVFSTKLCRNFAAKPFERNADEAHVMRPRKKRSMLIDQIDNAGNFVAKKIGRRRGIGFVFKIEQAGSKFNSKDWAMRKVEVGLRVAALPANAWAWLSNGTGKVAHQRLPIVAVMLFGVIVAALNLVRLDSRNAHEMQPAPLRGEFANAAPIGLQAATTGVAPPRVVKPEIVLPDIFIPVPAEMVAPAPNYFHAPVPKNGTFKHSQR